MRVGASFARRAEATDSRWRMRVGASCGAPASAALRGSIVPSAAMNSSASW